MKKRLKRIISVLISVIMIAGLFPAWTVGAGGTGVQEKINQIKAVYPSGSYFTASGSACYDNGGEDCRLGNIPSRGGLPSGSYVAGIVGEAWSCYGFARYCFYYIFGKNFTSSPTVSSPSLGDCISLNNGAHHAIYLREDSQYYYVFDSNGVSVGGSAETGWITDNRVMYEHAMRKSSWSITTIYHASNYDSVNGSSTDNSYESVMPEKPVITGLKTVYYCNEEPVFSWTETANTTHNNLWLYKFNYESRKWETYEHTFYIENNTKRSLPEGYYSLMIQSCNSEYFFPDGSTWLYVESDAVNFSVIDTDISSMNDLIPSASAILGDSVYERYDYETDWESAQKWCEAQGGYLATISNEEENSCISSITTCYCWIGAVSKEKNGIFEWVTGEPFTYTNWGEGEPSNSNNNEDYVHIQIGSQNNEDGSWNDSYVNSYLVKGFILERPNISLSKITVNTNPTKTVYDIGESIDLSGLELRADYSNGTYKLISEGFETSGFSSETAGTKTVTVSYGGKTTSFTVTVNEPEPDIDENAPQIILESKKVTKGKEFTVTVTVKNNPGFSYLELTPTYSSELTLVGVENGELINDLSKGKQYIWVADNDVTDDGILLIFTFTTADSIEPGNYEVGFIVRSCVNYDEQNVDISVVNGAIEIVDYKYGDANGDGEINGQDVVRIKKYLANYDYDTETSTIEINAGADANGDGVINGQDVVRIKKYLANYDYDTDTSTIVLGPQN